MRFSIQLADGKIGPGTVQELARQLGEKRLTGQEPAVRHSRMGESFGLTRHFPELRVLSGHAKPGAAGKPHVPNHIPLKSRLWALVAIGIASPPLYFYITTGQTAIWASKNSPNIIAKGLWALPMAAMSGGLISAGLCLIVDHYDRRPNERTYERWGAASGILILLGKLSAICVYHYLKSHPPGS